MPAPEVHNRPHTAVYWEKVGVDRYNNVTVRDGVDIKVRWVWTKGEALDPEGKRISIDATVILAQDVSVGDQLWLGDLEDWYGTGSGGDDTEVMEIVSIERTEDLKGRNVYREVGLKRMASTRGANG